MLVCFLSAFSGNVFHKHSNTFEGLSMEQFTIGDLFPEVHMENVPIDAIMDRQLRNSLNIYIFTVSYFLQKLLLNSLALDPNVKLLNLFG